MPATAQVFRYHRPTRLQAAALAVLHPAAPENPAAADFNQNSFTKNKPLAIAPGVLFFVKQPSPFLGLPFDSISLPLLKSLHDTVSAGNNVTIILESGVRAKDFLPLPIPAGRTQVA